MKETRLNIISFDNPYPPNYGGIIDVFYKVKALHEIGYSIYFHCFAKEIPEHFEELKAITTEVFFYKTNEKPLYVLAGLPFSVISRSDAKLAENLAKIEAPILYEGLKTTCLVNDIRLRKHKKILRLQNIEEDYFEGIARSEQSIFKKILFKMEARKYRRYKDVFSSFQEIITLSKFENESIQRQFAHTTYIPVFHGNEKVVPLEGFGEYSLYHGDLNTSDNRKSVAFLINVFKKLPNHKLVIAAGSNEAFVTDLIGNSANIEFVKLNDFSHLKELLQKAHTSISWSFQKSGTKLKAINSLFNTRFCIINENIIDDETVADLCELAKTEEELIAKIEGMAQKPFSEYPKRKEILENYMSDVNNARKIEALINRIP
ncbi:hypothetical protein [Flavobacterium pedocola]